MQNLKTKIIAILICVFMTSAIAASTNSMLFQNVKAQTNNTIETFSFINVSPNPCSVGQQVTVNFWLAVPIADSELAQNMTVNVIKPDGTNTTLGPFHSDLTGGTDTYYTPATTGNYTFQFFYGGQTLIGAPNAFGGNTFAGYVELPSMSAPVTLSVTNTAATGIQYTPLPTQYWETPVNAENIQNWYQLTGSWMGYAANTFAATGGYNDTGNYNPYTAAPLTAHILWTKPYCVGGVSGGELGNSEQASNFWTTSQYDPKYAPIIMNGIEYSTWYTTTTSTEQGIIAINLFTGQTMFVINTTNPLRAGMQINFENINQYGVVGPYIFAASNVGTFAFGVSNWYMYDGMTGQYLCEIDNAPSFSFLGQDPNGNIIGYAFNSTTGSMLVNGNRVTINNTAVYGPAVEMFNLTQAMQQTGLNWAITQGTKYQWQNGLQWATQSIPPVVNGIVTAGLGTGAFGLNEWTGNTLVVTAGATSVEETVGWLVEAGISATTGSLLWIQNRTGGIYTPYTRLTNTPSAADGVYVEINQATYEMAAYSVTTGQQVWTNSLNVPMADGNMPNTYDVFDFETVPDATTGVLYVWALGGDVWAVNMTNGNIIWSWSTIQANGPSGTETPYGIFPIWVFSDEALANINGPVLYLSEGHEYSPPLFHDALELALNGTTGQLIWSNLGFDDTATAVAYGVMTTFNAYDGQLYAYAQGPTKTTVTANNPEGIANSPMVISGTVTDISAGASQSAVAKNFPNGLPAVSDASMTQFMEYVYEQQPHPNNTTGVTVTLTATDPNNNLVTLGTTTSDASGSYGLTWTPTIPGNYTISATFTGSNAYYGSYDVTHVFVSNAAATQAPSATPISQATTQSYVLGIGIATIIVIIIIGAVLALLLLRKHP
jgi:hypothetical protein